MTGNALVRVHLSNVRRYGRDVSIALGRGATIVVAPNGTGKSALFEAIEFALTGKVARLADDLGALVRHQTEKTTVALEFVEGLCQANLVRGKPPQLVGDRSGVLGNAKLEDLPYLLRLTHLLDQRDTNWFVHAAAEQAGASLARLPVGRAAAQAGQVLGGARKAASGPRNEAESRKHLAEKVLDDWRSLLDERARWVDADQAVVDSEDLWARFAPLSDRAWGRSVPRDDRVEALAVHGADLSARLDRHVETLRKRGGDLAVAWSVVRDHPTKVAEAVARGEAFTKATAGREQLRLRLATAEAACTSHEGALARTNAAHAAVRMHLGLLDDLAAERANVTGLDGKFQQALADESAAMATLAELRAAAAQVEAAWANHASLDLLFDEADDSAVDVPRHHDEVVGIPHHPRLRPCRRAALREERPVEPVEERVRQQRRDYAPLWGAARRRLRRTALVLNGRPQERFDESENRAVGNPGSNAGHQFVMRDRVEVALQVRVVHRRIAVAKVRLDFFDGVEGRAPGPKPVRAVQEIRVEDRLQEEEHRCLHHPIPDGGNAQRTQFSVRLRDVHALHWLRAVGLQTKLLVDARQELRRAVLFVDDLVHRHAVDARCSAATLGRHR
jgi:hypothetical protein